AVPELRTSVQVDENETTLVDIKANVTQDLLRKIKEVGGTVVNSFPQHQAIRARIPIQRLESIAESPDARSIRSADEYQLHKVNTSEGDLAHGANVARATFGVDGTGVRIGVISDSVEALSDLQDSDDVPSVTVLSGQGGIGTSEGTAMLEIVHDLAPGAELFFATANGGQAQFSQNILDLRAAGCDIIVDDVGYFAEPVFQDGIIAQAVADVVADGAQYYSSAGNSGNLNDATSGVWEGDFIATPAPLPLVGFGDAHDFGGGTNFNTITLDSPFVFTLQWSDPQGGSANDYDLFLLNSDLTQVFASSTNLQDGDDDPFEIIDSRGFNDTGNVLVIIGRPGAQARYLHLNANRGQLGQATDGQTSGHSAATGAFSVAAVNVADANGGAFGGGGQNQVELFSSDGPRRIFHEADGTPITPANVSSTGGVVRQKPDIAAADAVATATPGFNPFFGTSAAAPHVAATGALLLELDPSLTPADVRAIYSATALDIEALGVDRDSGVGIIMADAALAAVQATLTANLVVAKSQTQNAASVSYMVTVNNEGPGDAPNVVVTETLPDGVTLVSTEGCVEDPTGVPTCSLGIMPAGGSKQYTVTVAVTAEGVGLLDSRPSVKFGR
ncbi:MAG: S8 family serine peptidase, partial [Alphaproteobacteria bacterium]